MKRKADVKNGFLKVADDLQEAIARAEVGRREGKIIAWIMCYTYGRRVKTKEGWTPLDSTPISINHVSTDLGIRWARTKQAVENLLALRILKTRANGNVGINSNITDWKCGFSGKDFQKKTPSSKSGLGQKWTSPVLADKLPVLADKLPVLAAPKPEMAEGPRTRAESCRVESRRGPASPTHNLPNGQPDTLSNRIKLGHWDYSPEDHPDWKRIPFSLMDEKIRDWKDWCDINEKKNMKALDEKMRAKGLIQ